MDTMTSRLFCFIPLLLATILTISAQDGGFGSATGSSGSTGSSQSGSSSTSTSGGTSGGGVGIIVGENYVLKPSDVISVEVYQEQDLNKQVRVEGDGTISLSLIGKVKIGGMSVAEAQSLVTDLYNRDYLVDPQVSLLVVSFSPKIVHVLGSVNSPGVVEIAPDRDLTLTEAIAAVRGISRLGNPKKITIKRASGDGPAQQIEVNFDRIVTDSESKDIVLKEGDTVYVPERII